MAAIAGRASLGKMAWRNLWRQRRRTWITLSSIAFATALAILITGFQDSNFAMMIDLAARLGGGHVTLQHPEYLDSPTLSRTVRDGELVEIASADPDVRRAVTRITGQLMVSTAEQSYGAAFIAYDPAREDPATLSLLEAVRDGGAFARSDDPGIILGQRLARNLHTAPGRKVVFTLTDKRGEIVRDVSRVSGILRTGAPSVDGALVLLPIDRMRDVLGYQPDEAIQVALFLDDQRAADRVAARLNRRVRGGQALAWHQSQPDLAGFVAMKMGTARFMMFVILLLVAAGIFNTLLASVMQRSREFGVLMALGFGPGRLFGLVMIESVVLGLIGVALGYLLCALPYWYLATTGVDLAGAMGLSGTEISGVALSGRNYVAIYPENAVAITLASLAATVLSGIYPASLAARVAPVEAIRLV
jgi:ABC-type lipoprotein release transport system permease subunit